VALARTHQKATLVERLGARAVRASLFDAGTLAPAMAGCEAVVNVATSIPPPSRAALRGAWRENDRIRQEGSAALVDAALAADASRYLQESIAMTYADGGDRWLGEEAPVDRPAFAATTADAEAAARRFTEAGGTGVVLRFAQFVAADSTHTLAAVGTARRGISPFLGDPSGYSTWVDADDAAAAVVAALGVAPGTWNVAEDGPATRAAQADALARAVGRARLRQVPAPLQRLGGPLAVMLRRSLRVSNHSFQEATGWTPAVRSSVDGWAAAAGA
jgi:nucleoside-diphosphate-sugar epimerase